MRAPLKKILFVCPSLCSFANKDLEILKKDFDVKCIQCAKKINWLKIILNIPRIDLAYVWFALEYAAISVFFSKLFGKKSIIIVGGVDVASAPEINYGQFILPWYRQAATRLALKYADKILVVDPGLIEDIFKNAKINRTDIEYFPTGYDPKYWRPGRIKQNVVLTVCNAYTVGHVKLKGLDTFVKSAVYLPNIKFVVIGIRGEAKNYLSKITPPNVDYIGFLPQDSLLAYYQSAKVYCQLSYHEGLPNALCEAMLCECVPVGTDISGIKMAINGTGFYVPYGDEKLTSEAVNNALNAPVDLGKKARERIANLFPIEKRGNGLISLIRKLCS